MSGKYLAARNAFAKGELSWTVDVILCRMVSLGAGFMFDEGHASVEDVGGLIGDRIEVTGRHVTDGWLGCDDLIFRSGTAGEMATGLIFYRENGLLIEHHDAVTLFPMLSAGALTIEIGEPGIFRL